MSATSPDPLSRETLHSPSSDAGVIQGQHQHLADQIRDLTAQNESLARRLMEEVERSEDAEEEVQQLRASSARHQQETAALHAENATLRHQVQTLRRGPRPA